MSNAVISVPAPTIRFFGVGNSIPVNPDLDATASVDIRLTSKLTHADGSVVETVLFDYGMETVRVPIFGVILARPDRRRSGGLSRFDDPDGSFGFRLLPVLKEFLFWRCSTRREFGVRLRLFRHSEHGFRRDSRLCRNRRSLRLDHRVADSSFR